MSFSLWLFANSNTAITRPLISKRIGNGNSESYILSVRSGPYLYVKCGAAGYLTGMTQILSQRWYHVAMVFDGTTKTNNVKMYLNGSPELFRNAVTNGVPLTSLPRYTNAALRIGGFDAGDTNGWNGLLDEVRIYIRALTQAEVLDLYLARPANMGPVVSVAGPVSGYTDEPVAIGGSAADDGQPGPLAYTWSRVSGSGSATFGDASSISTTVTISAPGTNILRLAATDGAVTTWADLVATITGAAIYPDVLMAGLVPGGFGWICQRDLNQSNATYLTEVSTNLVSWFPEGGTENVISTSGSVQTIRVTVPTDVPAKFIRMRMDP